MSELNGAENGHKVIAKVTGWPENSKFPYGKITRVIGYPGENDTEMQSILIEHDFPLFFSEKTINETDKISVDIPESEIRSRRDFRDTLTVTIDPEDAKDFDDALSIRRLKNNNWETGVHIADVSFYVKENSALDREAYTRGTSVYLVDRVNPMLPERLSNGICSLNPGEDKLCFSAVFEMNDNAEIVGQWFGKTIIKSNRRYNYDEVQKIIETQTGEYAQEISVLNRLAQTLRNNRIKSNAINFESREVKFKLDEKGNPVGVYIKISKESHKLVEEFMLLANKKVAELIGKKKKGESRRTFVYRIHDMPIAEKLQEFNNFVRSLGYKTNMNVSKSSSIAGSFNSILRQVSGKQEENIISQLAIRTMAKAVYSTKNIGHYGLAFDYYTHFTSPIRRYPDLIVHRLLERYLHNGQSVNEQSYENMCIHCSKMEDKAVQAERESIKLKQAEFFKNKIGQLFDGIISGMSRAGIYIEITENKCEGMVSFKDMTDDYYCINEDTFSVTGKKTGNKYRLGDKVRIKIKSVNLPERYLNFVLSD